MIQKAQTGIAAEFWFFSQLHRLGYESYITLGNTKSVDIVVKLNDKLRTTLSFDVKAKLKFGGAFQYLDNIPNKENHFVVFIDLKTEKESSNTKKRIFLNEPQCYIVKSKDLDQIAHAWKAAKTSTTGYGFSDKMLWYLKHQEPKSITKNNIEEFKKAHKLSQIDFQKYEAIVWTLEDFENRYYSDK